MFFFILNLKTLPGKGDVQSGRQSVSSHKPPGKQQLAEDTVPRMLGLVPTHPRRAEPVGGSMFPSAAQLAQVEQQLIQAESKPRFALPHSFSHPRN